MIIDAFTSRLRCPSSVGESAWWAYVRRQPLVDLCPAARYDGQNFYRAPPSVEFGVRCSLIAIGSSAGQAILNVRVEDSDRRDFAWVADIPKSPSVGHPKPGFWLVCSHVSSTL